MLLHKIISRANSCSFSERVPPCRLTYATTVELSVFTKTWRLG